MDFLSNELFGKSSAMYKEVPGIWHVFLSRSCVWLRVEGCASSPRRLRSSTMCAHPSPAALRGEARTAAGLTGSCSNGRIPRDEELPRRSNEEVSFLASIRNGNISIDFY